MGDYGGSSSFSSSAAMPAELHLKMSKKIAQLTKVIFHLNTRNEDFQTEFTHLKQLHALEQQQLTRDAAAKLTRLTEQLQAHKDADTKAAKDKQQLLKDLSTFQQQAATQQQAAQTEFQRRVQMLEEQVETSRRAFVDRIQQLTRVAETQQRTQQSQATATTSALQAQHEHAIEELKQKHSEEVEQVVMSSNAKYTQMLGEQLKLQDALKAELATQRLEWETTATQQQQAQLTQWQNEREEAQRRFDEMKQQLVGKMELLLVDAETLRGHETRLRADKDELLKTQGELQRQLKMLELQVAKAQQETLSVRKDSDAHAHKLVQTLTTSQEMIAALTQEIGELKKTLASRDVALQQAVQERDALQLELLQGSASLSEKHAQHTQQLSERDLKLANLQAELARQREQAAATDALHAKKIQGLEPRVAELTRELEELQKKLASAELLRATVQKDKDKTQLELTTKLAEADTTIATLRADHTKTVHEMTTSHALALDELTKSHADKVATLKRDADARVRDVESQLTQHSSASMEKAVSEAKRQHAQAIAQLQDKADTNEAKWMREIADREAQIQKLHAELTAKTKEAAEALVKVGEFSAKLKTCEEQLAQTLAQKEQLQKSSQKTQKERDETFQKQLKELAAQHESVVKRLASEKERLVTDHKQTLLQLARESADKLRAAQAAWEADQKTQLSSQNASLSAFYEQQLQDVNEQLQFERERAEQAARTAREHVQRLEESRASDVESFHAEVRRLTDKTSQRLLEAERAHHAAMETTIVAHTQELDRRDAQQTKALDDLVRLSTDEAEQKRAQLTAQHQQAMETLRQTHTTAVQSLHDALTAQRNSEALALRAEMAQKLKELRMQKDAEHAKQTSDTATIHAARVATLQREADALTSALAERTTSLAEAQRDCVSLTQELAVRTRESQERLSALERANREEVEKLKLAAKRDLDRVLEENLVETRQLSEQFEETRRLMSDHVAALKRSVAEWETKYARRESREEDVERIAWLERSCVEKDALVKQTLDEMAYFKRELLNREEMYNKTFARTPNVGVLQVLKPHVLLQAQMSHSNSNAPPAASMPVPPASQQSARTARVKPQRPEELQRRGSERSANKKALPPLGGNNNQPLGF